MSFLNPQKEKKTIKIKVDRVLFERIEKAREDARNVGHELDWDEFGSDALAKGMRRVEAALEELQNVRRQNVQRTV